MLQVTLLCALLTQCGGISCTQPSSIRNWLTGRLSYDSPPLTFLIRLEEVIPAFQPFKSKRSIFEGIAPKESRSLIAEITPQFDSNSLFKRVKRTLENGTSSSRVPRSNIVMPATGGPKDLHLKANLRYHHQQRHPNGSVSGSYAQMDPNGQLKVTHYVHDDRGFREYPEETDGVSTNSDSHINSPSGHVSVVTNSNSGILPPESNHARSAVTAESATMNFVPNIAPPYNTPAIDALQTSPIVHSAHGSIQQFSPRSPLFDKYYRPSPEEVQRSYEYHRVRTVFDPSQFRPTDMTPIPEIPGDRQPELKSVYSEYQMPYRARSQDESANGYLNDDKELGPNYAPPILPLNFAARFAPSQDANPQTPPVFPYPQTLEHQLAPMYVHSYEGSGFIPANTAALNKPYPTNTAIYGSPATPNVAAYGHAPSENIPGYQQLVQQVYYGSASNSQPTATAKP